MDSPKLQDFSVSNSTILRVIVAGFLVYFLVLVHELILVFLTGLVFASFVEAPVQRLARYRVPRIVTVTFIFFFALVFVAGLLYILIPTLFSELASLVQVLNKFIPDQSVLHTLDADTVQTTKKLFLHISNNAPIAQVVQSANNALFSLSGGVVDTLTYMFGGLFNILLAIIFAFYLSVQENGIENLLRIITPRESEAYVVSLWRRTERKIGLWVQSQLMLGFIMSLITFITLSLFHVEYALLLSLLVLVCDLVPFGLVIAAVPAILFGYTQGGIFFAFKLMIIYLVLAKVESYVISPLVTKRLVGVPPIIVILSVLVGIELAGAWGVMLAIPVSVFILEYLDDLEKSKKELA